MYIAPLLLGAFIIAPLVKKVHGLIVKLVK